MWTPDVYQGRLQQLLRLLVPRLLAAFGMAFRLLDGGAADWSLSGGIT